LATVVAKRGILQGSTIGSLIKIVERHGITATDIAYLKWIKDKRDYFVHRMFHEGVWPGDMDGVEGRAMTRRLLAIQNWLGRAERRVWRIFEEAGFLELKHIDGGFLASNVDLGNVFKEHDG